MVFDFAPTEQFNFLTAFAGQVGTSLEGDTLTLPLWLGVGVITRIRLSPDFSLLLHQYILSEELILRRTAVDNTADRVNVLFQGLAEPARQATANRAISADRRTEYTIRITSPNINSELRLPPDVPTFLAVLSMARPALRQLLRLGSMNGVVEQILVGRHGFLFYETMNAEAQKTLQALMMVNTGRALGQLRTWIQVQELLCWLFDRLLARDTQRHRPIHPADAEQLGRIRAAVVADLSTPPRLPELASMAGMSLSKLTDLFRQVFGDSIYDYFQKVRLAEAGFLLQQAGYSVSETGHQLGFSNLSHFSRLFEKHYGTTPKRFVMTR